MRGEDGNRVKRREESNREDRRRNSIFKRRYDDRTEQKGCGKCTI